MRRMSYIKTTNRWTLNQLHEDIEHHIKSYSVPRNDLKGSLATLERIDLGLAKQNRTAPRRGKVELL